jgi:hypothetical protein
MSGEVMPAKLHRTHCPHGHPYTPENTYWWHGTKVCRTCRRERHRAEAELRRSWRKDAGLRALVGALREGA